MDLKQYYADLREEEARLVAKFPKGEVHVTSLFHRERGSTAGSVFGASWRNAARVITDGTHRLSTEEEIVGYKKQQESELRRNILMEQTKKRQYITVINSEAQELTSGLVPRRNRAQASGSAGVAVADVDLEEDDN